MASKKEARQAAAYEACKLLIALGGLDEYILPAVESSSESDDDEVDAPSQPKTGTKKRQRSHLVKVRFIILIMSMKVNLMKSSVQCPCLTTFARDGKIQSRA